MPVRRVHNRASNIIGQFPSLKLGRMVAFESTLERDFIYWLEFDPAVLSYEEQPLAIPYPYRGRLTTYTPDFLVRYTARSSAHPRGQVVECKPEAQLGHPDNQRKFAAGRQWCDEHGYQYRVVTDRDLRTGSRLANVKVLTRFARAPVSWGWARRVAEVLAGQPQGLCLAEMVEQLRGAWPESEAMAGLYHLLYHGMLVADLDQPLSRLSRVSLAAPAICDRRNEAGPGSADLRPGGRG